MQLQMETADLNECDFLETQFSEEGDDDDPRDPPKALMTGTMIYFMKDGKPHYEYEPIDSKSETWFDDAMERNQAHMWMKTIHWRLEKMSCVLVLRNKLWFQHAIQVLADLWQTVENERTNPLGHEHRAPKRRSPPTATNAATNAATIQFMQSWLKTANPEPTIERKCLFDMDNL